MKSSRLVLSIAILMATLAVVSASNFNLVFAAVPKCTCWIQATNRYGIVRSGDCSGACWILL